VVVDEYDPQGEARLNDQEWFVAAWLLGASAIRVSTPLVLAALGGLMSERAGVINIALEGMMLVGAFAAAATAYSTHSPWIGAGAGAVAGSGLALIYGFAVIRLRTNQIVAGTAINMMAMGLVPFVSKLLYGVTGSTPALSITDRFHWEPTGWAVFLTVAIWGWMRATPSGLWMQFAGEHPVALAAAGVRVNRVRWACVALSGALAGLGGAALSTFLSSSYSRNMTAGRGFMALAALIFGKWKPVPTAAACLLFGVADALQIRLQGVVLWGTEPIPVQFIQILPYIVTVFVLAGFVGNSRPPQSLGLPYESR